MQTHHCRRARPRAAVAQIVLLLALLTGLAGCSKQRFEFLVVDESGAPLADVEVSYQIAAQGAAETVVVGHTDTSGSLIVTGKQFAPGRQYLFRKACSAGQAGERFVPESCALASGGGAGQYTFALRDGLVRRPDLSARLPGKGWPGRTVTLTCEAAPDGAAGGGRQRPLTRILDLSAPAGASVRVNDRAVGVVPETGWLNTEFCPGDSAHCFAPSVAVTVALAGHATRTIEAPLPEPLGTVQLAVELTPGASGESARPRGGEATPSGGPAGGAEPAAGAEPGMAQVRIENRGMPFACGADGDRPPVLLANDLSTVVRPSPATTEWKTYFDLLLKAGEVYCVAVRCPDDDPGPLSWNPWDAQAAWYSFRVPTDATRLFLVLPSYEAGRSLKLTPASDGSWKGFDAARATRITRPCPR